jgi:hypothetical protein
MKYQAVIRSSLVGELPCTLHSLLMALAITMFPLLTAAGSDSPVWLSYLPIGRVLSTLR